MKVIHYGQDYAKVIIGSVEHEVSISIAQGIDRLNKRIEVLKKDCIKKARERNIASS